MNQPMTDDDSMNLSKYLSSAGVCSRRGAAELVAGGAVAVNGTTAQSPGQRVTRKDRVTLHGKPVAPVREYVYIMLHKPRGYVCTMEDPHAKKKAVDLIPLSKEIRIVSVGRLDKDSEGLLLMTNDGAFAQAVTHPSGGISKLYRVTVQPRADESQILKLSSGVVLDDGTKTLPCAINVVTDEPGRTVMEMTLKEGKNREIRRMCESVGLEVVRLKRNAEGVVKLGMLKPGTYRELTKAEVNGLRAAAVKGRAQTRSAVQQSKAAERRPRGPVGKNAPRKQK